MQPDQPGGPGSGVPTEVVPGIWQVPLAMPVRVEPVNAYLLLDDDGAVTVFDTGTGCAAQRAWQAALRTIGVTAADVRRIVISHHHPDHIGGAGALHRLTRAPVLASRSTMQQAPDVWGDGGRMESYFASIDAHVREHGLPDDVIAELQDELAHARELVVLPPPSAWEELDDGDRIEVGGRSWRVRLTPGHADGHLVLHDAAEGLLLAGDVLLERISPAVGRFPRHERDPLARYLESLMVLAMLDPHVVLPGHGMPFIGGARRARELVAHHAERIEECVDAIRQLGRGTAYDAAQIVFARVFARASTSPAELRFATTETLAHLERARIDGRLERERDPDELVRFAPASA